MLGHHQHASVAGGPMIARLKCYLDPPTSHQLKKQKTKQKKNVFKVFSDKIFWICAWNL